MTQQQTHKQIVLPPLCMPPQSFPQCCPPPCFYPPPCFPCCPPNPCCPQACYPPCPPPCCPPQCCPPCQPCCQSPCVPCCPKVSSAPCCPPCPPQCTASNQTKTRCNCCGGRSTLICVPRGSGPPCCPPQCCPPCCPPCRPCCPPQCCGDGGSSDKPPSFNNCNFYCSELPKGFGGNGGSNCVEDDCCCSPDCCPSGEGFDCDDYGGNRAAGDDQLAPIPRGSPRKYHSPRSRASKNDWCYDTKTKRPIRRSSSRKGKGVGRKRNENDEADLEIESQWGDEIYPKNKSPPPRPSRRHNGDHDYSEDQRSSSSMRDRPSFLTYYQTTASSKDSPNPSILTHTKGPSVNVKGTDGKNSSTWTKGVKETPPTLRRNKIVETKMTDQNDQKLSNDVETETIDKAATAPVQRADVATATNPIPPVTVPARVSAAIGKNKIGTASGMEVRNQPRQRITKLSTDRNNVHAVGPGNKPRLGSVRRKFKNPLNTQTNENPLRSGDKKDKMERTIRPPPGTNDSFDPKEKEIDKLLWSLIPSAATNGQTPISTLNIFGPCNPPDKASSDFISAPPTQPGCPVDCQLVKIQSGPCARTDNELRTLLYNQRRRARSCDHKKKKKRLDRVLTACEFICDDDNDDLTYYLSPLCPNPVIQNYEKLKSSSNSTQRSSIVCETLASILKKDGSSRCKGIDQVKFARQDFCVMTCFVERRRSRSPQPCQNVRNDPCPSPLIVIPPPPNFNARTWKNYKFNSTPSSHQTGCSPCSPCPCPCPCPQSTKLPSIHSPKNSVKNSSFCERQGRCSSPLCVPQNFCGSPCPIYCGQNHGFGQPGSPYCSPCPTPRRFRSKKNKNYSAGSPTPITPPPEHNDVRSNTPPRPPPPIPPRIAPPRPPPPTKILKLPTLVPKSDSNNSSNYKIEKNDSRPSTGQSQGSAVSESTHTWNPQCSILPPCYCPPSPLNYCVPGKVTIPTFSPKRPHSPPPDNFGPPPETEGPPPETFGSSTPPTSPVKIPPGPYGLKHPPKPALVLSPISPRHSLSSESSSQSSEKPPLKPWVNTPPPKKYFEFVPRLPADDCCNDMRKTKKTRRRCKCPDLNNNFKSKKQPCCESDSCCCCPDEPCPPQSKNDCCTNPCC